MICLKKKIKEKLKLFSLFDSKLYKAAKNKLITY